MTTILVIDDEWAIVDTLRGLLEDEGYNVITARDGSEGLACLPTARPDLVLVDLMMPGITGTEVLTRLREDDEWRGLPVVLMSAGRSLHEQSPEGVFFLPKPFQLDRLLRTIKEALATPAGPGDEPPPEKAPEG